MRTIQSFSLAFAFVSLALASCGDDPDPGGTSTTTTTASSSVAASSTTGTTGTTGTGGTDGTGGSGGSGGSGGTGGTAEVDIYDQLKAIPGASVFEDTSEIDGYRYFHIDFDQPVDHKNPNGQHFTQRLLLHHIDTKSPLVLASTGYYLFLPWQYLEEPAKLLKANQIIVEHRYFANSRPDPADWSLLNIEQAAADHHRVVEAFRAIYGAKWISTGVSKGGMTSVYHRRFYPNDVDGTVAYVAPHTGSLDDPRYVDFVNQVGDAACRQKLQDFQREVLLRRNVMLTHMADEAAMYNVQYDLLGIDPALESTVIGFAFVFWQYFGASRCNDIPPMAATDDEVWAFFNEIGTPLYAADPWVLGFEPYYWQAYTQLGTPGISTEHLKDLLLYDFTTIDDLPSIAEDPTFDPAPMQDVSSWLSAQGSRILFVYGETDPWTAAAFDPGGATESYKLIVPGGNHGAGIVNLAPADRQTAFAALEAWTGVVPVVQPKVMPRPMPPPFRMVRRMKMH
jgi:hypothetical protein